MIVPKDTVNLDIYGDAPLEWGRAEAALSASPDADLPLFLSTVSKDGRPHVVGIGALWLDDGWFFVSGSGTRKSRQLAANPACAIAARLPGIDVTFEGSATVVSDADTLDRVAARYRAGGWPAEVADGALTAPYSAPSAGPPPWYVYRMTVDTAVGVASAEPHGATRWDF